VQLAQKKLQAFKKVQFVAPPGYKPTAQQTCRKQQPILRSQRELALEIRGFFV
jgi:hypothetical protein